MVLVWTALSYGTPSKVPHGVPRRLFSPLPWESASLHHWTVVKVINEVPLYNRFLSVSFVDFPQVHALIAVGKLRNFRLDVGVETTILLLIIPSFLSEVSFNWL